MSAVKIRMLLRKDEERLREVFRDIMRTGHEASVVPSGFWNEEDFFEGMTGGECWPFEATENGVLKGFFWLNRLEGRFARLHFCTFDKPETMTRAEFGKEVLRQAISLNDDDGYLFDMFMGITPESNKAAVEFSIACGAKRACVLPYASTSSTGMPENGVVSVVTREYLEVE